MIFIERLKFLLLFCLLSPLISCSKQKESSRLVIEFETSAFSGHKKSSSKATGLINPNGPNWGVSDPQSIHTDIQCFGIFVYADEIGMRENSCKSVSGTKIQFGPRAGFFPIQGRGEILVPSGVGRKIVLMGMSSLDGTCDRGFDVDSDIRFSNYSHPYILGQAVTNLQPGDNRVEIELSDAFSDDNKIQTCDFIDDDGDDDFHPQELNLSFYDSKRTIWVSGNTIPRRVNLIYDSSQVTKKECSSDNGVTFSEANCGANPFAYVWQEANYTNHHYIRLTYLDGTTSTKDFKPSVTYPGLEFVSCDYTFSGIGGAADSYMDNSSSTTFSNAVNTNNKVVCLEGGVNITAPSSIPNTLSSFGNDVVVVAKQGEVGTLSNGLTTKGTITLTSKSGIRFVGINITCAGQTASPAAIYISNSNDIEFQDVHIDEEGGQGPDHMLKLAGTYNVNGVRLLATTVKAYSTGLYAASLDNIEVVNSYIEGKTPIYSDNAPTITINNTTLKNKGTTVANRLVSLNNPASSLILTINSSELLDISGGGMYLNGGSITFEMNDNKFRRTTFATSGNNSPIISTNSSPTISSSSNGNLFCHEDPTNASIHTSLFNGTPNLTGFDVSAQIGNGIPSVCP